MASSSRSADAFVPAPVALFVRRRLAEIGGALLLAAGLALLLALASYHSNDPSLNVATRGVVRNWMGLAGASVADLSIQSLGCAAWLIGVMLIAWGWRIVSHKGIGHAWLRIPLVPVTLLAATIAFAAAGGLAGFAYPGGPGGVTGTVLLADVKMLAPADFDPTLVVSVSSGVIALAALLFALGLDLGEWRAVGRGLWWAGDKSARAGLAGGKLGVRAGGVTLRAIGRMRGERIEPRFGRIEPEIVDGAAAPHEGRREPRLGPLLKRVREKPPEHDPDLEKLEASRAKVLKQRREPARQDALNLTQPGKYQLPALELLEPTPQRREHAPDADALAENARMLVSVLDDFGVNGDIVKVRPGPVVTLYELEPAPGTKTSRVIGLSDDIARSMSAVSVRVAVVPGRNVIGIELPNARRETVSLRELLGTEAYERTASKLTLVLGKDIGGAPVIGDLSRMPHLLIAGTTGSGKSVAINTMILSLLYRLPPEQARFIMIDPKMLELSVYDGIPHLLAPVVTDPGKAVVALRWTVREMESRYRAMSTLGVRNIAGYNQRLEEARKKGEKLTRTVQTGFDPSTGKPIYEDQPFDLSPLPYIVVIVDEMADLMLVAGKDVEAAVQRLSQMARAAGIHLIMATQRPSVDVITGTIKANFPTRISFQVTSKIDSRTILGEGGAETLLGQGDMLYMTGGGRIARVHGPLVTDDEVERVVRFLKDQGAPEYLDAVTETDEEPGFVPGAGEGGSGDDALYDQAVALVCRERKASTSFIQRHLQIGYNRAARIIERMEVEQVVSRANHVGKREVLARNIDNREV